MTASHCDCANITSRFFDAWNAAEPQLRQSELVELCSPDIIYADPHMPQRICGVQAYVELSDKFREMFPTFRFHPETPQSHHGFGKMPFSLKKEDGSVVSKGFFVCEYDSECRIRTLVAFGD